MQGRTNRRHRHVEGHLRDTAITVVGPGDDITARCEHEAERLVLVDVLAGGDIGRKDRPVCARASLLQSFDSV